MSAIQRFYPGALREFFYQVTPGSARLWFLMRYVDSTLFQVYLSQTNAEHNCQSHSMA